MSRSVLRFSRQLACLAFVGLLLAGSAAAEPVADDDPNKDFSGELPRIAPVEADEALDTFEVHPDFRLEQVAAEPLVQDPVAMAFDADGRLYVVEMRDYSEQEQDQLGVVRLLEDTDQDGRFDRGTIFAEGLSWPTAIACYDGGVFVGAAPDVYYLRDTTGDGLADEQRVVLRGFGRSNVQGLLNSFTWGLDNRVHGATSSSGAQLTRPEADADVALVLSGRDFAFDPRSLKVAPTSGGAQHGLSFDRWGRKFVCHNSDHIQLVMFEDRYVARNPFLEAPSARISIAADGPQAEVYRISPVEPWRIVRTRLRTTGVVPGAVEGGGRAAGYFTGATGVTIYRGDAWPEEYLGQAVIGDVGSNIVHRKLLESRGVELVARRADEGREFIASRDIWFRPCQFANAPDGTLYVLDVYREVIEHPHSIPPMIKRHLDLTSGRDRGRIYRIVPRGYEQRPLPRLSDAPTAELVATLEHPNGWHRDTAARLIYERQDSAAVPLLEGVAASSQSPEGRMHALYALDGLHALTVPVLLGALDDAHPRVRQHAVRLSEPHLADSAELQARLMSLVEDDDVLVRYQLAFSLGEFQSDERNAALSRLARRDGGDRWIRLAIQSSLAEGAPDVFARLLDDETYRQSDHGRSFLVALATQIGAQNRQADLAAVIEALESLPPREAAVGRATIGGLSAGLAKRGQRLDDALASLDATRFENWMNELLSQARRQSIDADLAPADRIESIRALALGPFDDAADTLVGLLDSRQPQEIQVAALGAMSRFSEDAVADVMIDAWPQLSPRLRTEASEVLFARPARLAVLLTAIEEGRLAPNDLDPARLKALLEHRDEALAARAKAVLGDLEFGRRQDVVESYRDVLTMPGDVARGEVAFRKVCAACHKIGDVGHEIGPNLAALQNRGAESILLNVLDPNREVNPQFVNYVIVTQDGRQVSGMIAGESATSVTLRRAESAEDTVLRVNIDQMQSTALSLMPEGVEKQLDRQALADLIAYLLALEPKGENLETSAP